MKFENITVHFGDGNGKWNWWRVKTMRDARQLIRLKRGWHRVFVVGPAHDMSAYGRLTEARERRQTWTFVRIQRW